MMLRIALVQIALASLTFATANADPCNCRVYDGPGWSLLFRSWGVPYDGPGGPALFRPGRSLLRGSRGPRIFRTRRPCIRWSGRSKILRPRWSRLRWPGWSRLRWAWGCLLCGSWRTLLFRSWRGRERVPRRLSVTSLWPRLELSAANRKEAKILLLG